ncbi:hypothetical protein WN51_07459 [Melipona quadrifasciata]|uniref:Uncharacterized protein n=1 Tax=Melipona quadrifasciata TaxID=166423 RepID=A0A0N0BJ75_9HYME|nr:hypothetical protein WN51_07459 [Melipona quadrifasciata]
MSLDLDLTSDNKRCMHILDHLFCSNEDDLGDDSHIVSSKLFKMIHCRIMRHTLDSINRLDSKMSGLVATVTTGEKSAPPASTAPTLLELVDSRSTKLLAHIDYEAQRRPLKTFSLASFDNKHIPQSGIILNTIEHRSNDYTISQMINTNHTIE